MEAQALPREAAVGWSGRLTPRALHLANDARLVTLVRNANTAAFEAIYDRYHRPILSFCRHTLGDPEEAADAVQHTFLAAYNAIVASEKTILLRAWLFTIARNRCYSVLRTRREQPFGELVEPATEGLAAQVQRREELRQLLRDMSSLPDDQRAALVLAELGTLNHQEIGTALGVRPAKVKALVFQARKSLIASRSARDTDCAEIREQLSTLRGGALRRANLRRHLRDCQGCREFRASVAAQRRSLAAILPVAPGVALKDTILATASGPGSASGALAGGGLLASTVLKGLALKGAVGGLLALIGTAGTLALVHPWRAAPATHHGLPRVLFNTTGSGASPRTASSPTGARTQPGVARSLSGSRAGARRRSGGGRTRAGRPRRATSHSAGGGTSEAPGGGSRAALPAPAVPGSPPVPGPVSAPTASTPAPSASLPAAPSGQPASTPTVFSPQAQPLPPAPGS